LYFLTSAVAAAVLAASSVPAATVNHSDNDGTILSIDALTGFFTRFSDMNGTLVTVTYEDNTTAIASFMDTGPDAGEAYNPDNFLVFGSGDTFDQNWTLENLSNLSIERIEFNGLPGNTLWDRTDPNPGTAGSAQGRDFEFVSSTDPDIANGNIDIDVLYENAVKLDSAAEPIRDLYSLYAITFLNDSGPGFLPPRTILVYRQDADNAGIIPETSTVLSGLALAGLGLVAVFRRFRRA
ncbi:MAG TPA: hypothetical protein PKE47_11540, partial [Verrucomicrobiota bacterium]|nr:hypothetical protein [Verrucomicrobiota bacterium]